MIWGRDASRSLEAVEVMDLGQILAQESQGGEKRKREHMWGVARWQSVEPILPRPLVGGAGKMAISQHSIPTLCALCVCVLCACWVFVQLAITRWAERGAGNLWAGRLAGRGNLLLAFGNLLHPQIPPVSASYTFNSLMDPISQD